ncbi:MAG: serine O-acetyltransferase [Azospirillaceae bacterium]|nr:serine O-acetyltransferase [Azospirillaceae bacterium]
MPDDMHSQGIGTLAATLWAELVGESWSWAEREPMLQPWLERAILGRRNFADALARLIGDKLGGPALMAGALEELVAAVLDRDRTILRSADADLRAHRDRNPSCPDLATPFLFFKGFQALQCHRIAHRLWRDDRRALALLLQSRSSEIFGVDIHPGARIGCGVFIDHATSIVIGETAVVGDDVSILHEVTLGGTGKESGDRHPKIAARVLIGAGAKVLGNITVGIGAKIGAGSVVLDPVPPHATVAGVPARVVGRCTSMAPALDMDHSLPHFIGAGI